VVIEVDTTKSEAQLKILYLTMRFPVPTQTFLHSDISALIDLGHNVSLATLCGKQQTDNLDGFELPGCAVSRATVLTWLIFPFLAIAEFQSLKIALYEILSWRGGRLSHYFFSIALLPRFLEIVRMVRRIKPHVVHAFWGHYPVLPLRMIQETCPGILASSFLGAYDLLERFPGTASILPKIPVVFTHSFANVADVARISQRSPHRVAMVHRGIPLNSKRLQLEANRNYSSIITASALTASKNVNFVLEVVRSIAVSLPVSFTVAGDGPEYSRLERIASNFDPSSSVKFLGHVSRDELFREMCKSSVFLFLSTKESDRLPNAVKEAMAAGCVCIVSKTRGIEELIPDKRFGFVVEEANVSKVASLVADVLRDPKKFEDIRINASSRIYEGFDCAMSMQAYVDEWRCAIA